jgi:transposase InsO family protein
MINWRPEPSCGCSRFSTRSLVERDTAVVRPQIQIARHKLRALVHLYGGGESHLSPDSFQHLDDIGAAEGKFRAECLNAHWFMSLDDARRKCEAWRRDYNEERQHSAIGNRVPIELANRSAALGPP